MVLPGKRNSTSLRNKPVNEDHGHHWTDIVDRKITWNDVLNKPDIPSAASLAQAIAVPPVYEVDEWSFKNIRLRDTNRTNRLSMIWNEDDTADRELKLRVAGSSPVLQVEADTYVNQDLTTDAGPEFNHVHLGTIYEQNVKNGIVIQAYDAPIEIRANSSVYLEIDKQNLDDCVFSIRHNTTPMFEFNTGNPGTHQFMNSQAHLEMNTHNISGVGVMGANSITVVSTTVVTNLNADTVDGSHASSFAPSAHNVLSATHGDTLADTVIAGDLIYGNATPKFARLAKGAQYTILAMGASLPAWSTAMDGVTIGATVAAAITGTTVQAGTLLKFDHASQITAAHGCVFDNDVIIGSVAAGANGSIVSTLGGEMVTAGTSWTAGAGFTASGTTVSFSGTGAGENCVPNPTLVVVPGVTYLVSYTYTHTSGAVGKFGFGGALYAVTTTWLSNAANRNASFYCRATTNGNLVFTSAVGAQVWSVTNISIRPLTNGSLTLNNNLIMTGGRIGIGTTNPAYMLDISQNAPSVNLFRAYNSDPIYGGGIAYNVNNGRATIDFLTIAGAVDLQIISTTGGWRVTKPFNVSGGMSIGATYCATTPITNGVIIEGKLGVGLVAPTAKMESLSTTEQLRLGYDASNYASFTVGATGGLTLGATGAGALFTVTPQLDFTTAHGTTLLIDHIGSHVHVPTFDNGIIIADAGTLSMQEYIEFTGATGTGYIKMVDNLADAFSIQEATNKYTTYDTRNGAELITDYKAHAFDTLTASTIVYASAAKVLTSLANAAGALTNDGAGALTWVAYSAAAHTHAGVYQPVDATLTSLALLGTAADKLAYTTAADTWAEAAITAAGRAILDDANAAAQRVTLGLEIGVNVQAYNAALFTPAYLFTYKAAEAALLTDTWEDVEFNGGDPVKVGITHDYAGANPGNMTIITAGTYEIDATALFRGNNASGVQMHIMYVTSGGGAVEIPGSWMEDSFHDYTNISAHALRARVLVVCAAASWIQVEVAVQNAASQIGYIDIGQNPTTWITATCLITRVG
jgi:hypothetical protein